MAADLPEALARLLGQTPTAPASAAPSPIPEALARLLGAPAVATAPKPAAPVISIQQAPAPGAIPFMVPTPAVPMAKREPTPGAFRGIADAGKKKDRAPPVPPSGYVNAPSIADIIGVEPEALTFHKNSEMAAILRAQGVQGSPDLDRIIEIPRRPSNPDQYPDLTERFRKPGGTMRLRPIQNAMLTEAPLANGMLGIVAAGAGKTLASLLLGAAMGAQKIVLLVPPQLRAQLISVDIPMLNQHWILPLDRLRVIAYSEISNAKTAQMLDSLKPDLIIADEAHMLKSRAAARTKRFLRYFKEHPECRFVGLSGTITRKSLQDYQHLSQLALKKNSPVPDFFPTLNEWAEALDVVAEPMPAGELIRLCNEDEARAINDPEVKVNAAKFAAATTAVRSGFRRRLVETPGVVATTESAVGTSLIIRALRPGVPIEVQNALHELRDRWEIAGDELTDILEVSRIARQLAAGIFTRWDWPDDIPDTEWLKARSEWHKEIREVLKRSVKGMDSPLLVTKAVIDGRLRSFAYGEWLKVKSHWNPEPPRETVWVSDFLVHEAVKWAKEEGSRATPAIIWFSHVALGEAIARVGGFPFFGAGSDAALTKVKPKDTPVIVASIKAHGTGKNLQWACKNLITTALSSGADMEQLIARTHRPGQEADEVQVDIFVHTHELQDAYLSSLDQAAYLEETQGQKQKLRFANKIGFRIGELPSPV